jgi:hypothetical protein
VALVGTDTSEVLIGSIIRVLRISDLETCNMLVAANVVPSALIVSAMMMKTIVPQKRRFLQETQRHISEDDIINCVILNQDSIY